MSATTPPIQHLGEGGNYWCAHVGNSSGNLLVTQSGWRLLSILGKWPTYRSSV